MKYSVLDAVPLLNLAPIFVREATSQNAGSEPDLYMGSCTLSIRPKMGLLQRTRFVGRGQIHKVLDHHTDVREEVRQGVGVDGEGQR